MEIKIVQGDITNFKGDAIVNAANSSLKAGGGVCGAIFKKAGYKDLQLECDKLAPIKTGSAAITKGYKLDVKYIIHAVGPIYQEENVSTKYLGLAYYNSLKLADKNKIETIAFPLISTGNYGFPLDIASLITIKTINKYKETFKDTNIKTVTLVAFDEKSFDSLRNARNYSENNSPYYQDILNRAKEYIDNYNLKQDDDIYSDLEQELENKRRANKNPFVGPSNLDDIKKMFKTIPNGGSWGNSLLNIMDDRNLTPPQVYKRCNISKQTFNKMINEKHYTPTKDSAIKVCIGLELDIDEAESLLKVAGYSLSDKLKRDILIRFFITNREYNMMTINQTLDDFNENLLL